jgi:hypothetical protein
MGLKELVRQRNGHCTTRGAEMLRDFEYLQVFVVP